MPLAVILDMDGLMLDTEPISLRVWRQEAQALGYELDDALCGRMIGQSVSTNKAMLLAHFGEGFPVDELARNTHARYRECLERDGVPHKPGLVDFLSFLVDRDVPRAVATSTGGALARHKLERAGVLHFFETVVGGDEVPRGKPAPDIFVAAAERLGYRPADCIVLEDSGPGIRGAADAGMIPILIPDGRLPAPETRAAAKFVVESLNEARLVVERLLEDHSVREA